MDTKSILKDALLLRPAERLHLMELLARSLNKPDENIEKLWAQESERRYKYITEGRVRTISMKEIVNRYKK